MQELWRIFAIFLIVELVTADNCQVSKYNNDCYCFTYDSKYIMECPYTETINSKNFKIEYLPRDYVKITCKNDPSWSTFHYEINSVTQEVKHFILNNCSLQDNVNMTEIAKLVGAENTRSLEFSNTLKYKILKLNKDHLRGFPNVVQLTISENDHFVDLDEDLLQHLPRLRTLILRSNKITSVPKNFFQYVPNLTTLELGNNKIQRLDPDTFKNLTNLDFLNLWNNELVELHSNIFADLVSLKTLDLNRNNLATLPQGIFDKLEKIERVNLFGNQFETLPGDLFQKNQQLNTVKLRMLRKLKTLPSGLFSNLTNLKYVLLDKCKLESLPEDLFQGSTELLEIYLNENTLRTLPKNIFDGLDKLKKLILYDNEIEDLPENLFSYCDDLIEINLTQNRINNISNSFFRGLRSLQTLSMSYNQITNIEKNAFTVMENIQKINLSHNNITNLLVTMSGYGPLSVFHACQKLQHLDLSFNRISLIFSDWIITPPSLFKYLDLSHNAVNVIMKEDLDFKHTNDFTIKLSHNNISMIDLSTDFEDRFISESRSNIILNIENNPIVCNCYLYDFVRYLDGTINEVVRKKLTIKVGAMECFGPKEVQGTPLTDLKSKDYKCTPSETELYDNATLCPKLCNQWKKPYDHKLIFDCSNRNLTEAPKTLCSLKNNKYFNVLNLSSNFLKNIPNLNQPGYERVEILLLSQNQIMNIPEVDFPPTLKTLELHDNKITTVSAEALKRMNSSLQNITLGGNPWKCNCEAREFQQFIQTSRVSIKDSDKITCQDSKKILKMLTADELCLAEMKMNVGIGLAIALLGLTIGTLAALYYRYQREIKVWLYAHQICLWFVTEEELDKDKPYDAFISYSHKDEDFVVNELVIKLEEGPRPFKLCIHFRDWLAGEWIPTQIAKSVKDSKRTIVVVSPNFLQSEWGRLEFRAAHSQALNEGRARVIVILYGDIGSTDKLEPELKTYLSMNTYVKWGDPWFWEKLRYALPHKPDLMSKTPGSRIFKKQHPAAQLNFNKNELKQSPESGMVPLTESTDKNWQNGSVLIEVSDDELKKLNSAC